MMSLKNPSPLSGVEECSRDLVAALRARLSWFCAEPRLHARFLNTLSLMEHIGSRKIMASQTGARLSQDTLKHLAEETRHAYFFKRAAERLAGRELGYAPAETIAGAAAAFYMGRLDAQIARELVDADREPPYLYMSLIVELRAIWFYRLYDSALRESQAGLSLASVLAEEELHLSSMLSQVRATDVECDQRIAEFAAFEDSRFRALWNALETGCAAGPLAAE
jgi:hypothetical protein